MDILISVFPQLFKGTGVTIQLFLFTLIGSIPLGFYWHLFYLVSLNFLNLSYRLTFG